jgi:hypothetical protein
MKLNDFTKCPDILPHEKIHNKLQINKLITLVYPLHLRMHIYTMNKRLDTKKLNQLPNGTSHQLKRSCYGTSRYFAGNHPPGLIIK